MTLLEDIKAERDQVSTEIRSVAQLVYLEMTGVIKEQQGCRPVVAAIVQGQMELHFPTWNTPREKAIAFASISEGLQAREASAAVTAFSSSLTTPGAPKPERAAVIMIQTHDWSQMDVHPYHIEEDNVVWTESFTADSIESPLVDISCAN